MGEWDKLSDKLSFYIKYRNQGEAILIKAELLEQVKAVGDKNDEKLTAIRNIIYELTFSLSFDNQSPISKK